MRLARLASLVLPMSIVAATILPTLAGAQLLPDAADDRRALSAALDLVDRAGATSDPLRSGLARQALTTLEADPSLADDGWLTGPLAANPPDLPRAKTRLGAALATLGTGETATIPGGRASLDQVLADRRFHPFDWLSVLPAWLVPVAVLLSDAFSWVGDQAETLLGIILSSRAFAFTLAGLAVVIAVAVVALYRIGLRASIVRQAETPLSAVPLPPTASQAIGLAREQAAAGEFRDACHYALLAALLAIEEQDGIRFDRSATNREHLKLVASQPTRVHSTRAAALERIVARFDPLWYGRDVVTRDDFAEIAALVDSVMAVRA